MPALLNSGGLVSANRWVAPDVRNPLKGVQNRGELRPVRFRSDLGSLSGLEANAKIGATQL